jgi:hypothetical protein
MTEPEVLAATRRSLHGVAELLLAGPQHRRSGTIRLRVVPGGFATVAAPDVAVLGREAVSPGRRASLDGRPLRVVAEDLGVDAGPPEGVYADGSGVDLDEVLGLDPAAADQLMGSFATGDTALRAFAPEATPVLWPEHFDLGITLDEVNYGLSPGDAHHPEPYAYVGPWRMDGLLGDFWNVAFGAARPLADLGGPERVRGFFDEGRFRAHQVAGAAST